METSQAHNCPACGYTLDSHVAAYEKQKVSPRPDDVTVCLKCLEPLVFDEHLVPQIWPPGLREKILAEHPHVIAQIDRLKEVIRLAKEQNAGTEDPTSPNL